MLQLFLSTKYSSLLHKSTQRCDQLIFRISRFIPPKTIPHTSIPNRDDDSPILGSLTTRNCAVLHQRKIAAEFSAVKSLPSFLHLVLCFPTLGFQIRPITANFGDIPTIYAARAEDDSPLFSVHFNRIDATTQAPVLLFCNGIAFSILQR